MIQQEDEGQVLGCLINHKNDPEMNDKCSAGVFHFQIISLDSYKLAINPNKLYREKERWILGKPKSRYRRDSWGGGWGPENVRERPNLFHLECKSEGSCHLHKLVNC